MLADILHKAEASSPSAAVIISIALMLFLAFLMTRVTKKLKLPNVTAYIITGILIGPYCLDFVPMSVVDGMDFLSDIALAFIAFSTGQFFRFSALKKNGLKVTVITLFEACFASVAIFILTYWVLGLSLAFSIVLSALAATTAPASTMMTIRQTGAKGDFVDTLLQTVALDNIIGLLAYSIAISLASVSISGGSFSISDVLVPMASNIGVLLLGCVFGILMKPLLNQKRSTDNRLIIMIAFLFAFCGICVILDISPLLGCMSMGTVYFNITDDEKLFKQLNYFNPPILLLFFVRSGMCFDLSALMSQASTVGAVSLLVVGVLYFVIRIISKYCGAFLGCAVTKKDKKVRNNLGLALIPQAGVAIGLAALGARTLGGEAGDALQTIILSSSILYELIGPVCAKMSLHLSGSYSDKLEELVAVSELNENGEKKTQLEMLIERIHKIQEELPKHTVTEDDEQAFTSAAEEQYENTHPNPNQLKFGRFKRR
ncbi:MAG: cation:proton antiporter [Clostridia bacterium]|nr:cation:proton antiporter [Clostridia bacterium]